MLRNPLLPLLVCTLLLGAPANAQTFVTAAVLDDPQARAAAPGVQLPNVASAGIDVDAKVAASFAVKDNGTPFVVQLRAAVRTARRHPEEFRDLLEMQAAYPSMDLTDSPVSQAVEWAIVASDVGAFGKVLGTIASNDERREANQLREQLLERAADVTRQDTGISTQVFADGSIRGTAEGKSGESVGTGALAVAMRNGKALWYASLTVASTEDTLTNGFGPALLAPGSGKALSSGLLSVLFADALGRGWGVMPYVSTSRHLWSLADTVRSATVMGTGLLLHREVVERVQTRDVSIALQIGPTLRWLGGDVSGLRDKTRQDVLGTDRTLFVGLEAGSSITVGDLVGALHLYYITGDDDNRVLGLSNLQMVAGFSVKGKLFGSQ